VTHSWRRKKPQQLNFASQIWYASSMWWGMRHHRENSSIYICSQCFLINKELYAQNLFPRANCQWAILPWSSVVSDRKGKTGYAQGGIASRQCTSLHCSISGGNFWHKNRSTWQNILPTILISLPVTYIPNYKNVAGRESFWVTEGGTAAYATRTKSDIRRRCPQINPNVAEKNRVKNNCQKKPLWRWQWQLIGTMSSWNFLSTPHTWSFMNIHILVHYDLLSMEQCQTAKSSWRLGRNCLLLQCQADGNIMQKSLGIWKYTPCTKMIGAVSSGHNSFGNSHMERNSRYSSFDHMHSPTPPSLGPWCYEEKMATPEQKAFCVVQFANQTTVWMCAVWPRVHTSNTCRICVINSYSYSFISTSFCNSVQHTYEYNQLPNCVNHFGTQCIKCQNPT
jgi:hypothetical protein